MDLAHMIVDLAAEAHKKECKDKTCTVVISIHSRYIYTILVTPLKSDMKITYKGLVYTIPNKTKDVYDEVIDFLVDAMIEESHVIETNEREYTSYIPALDEKYCDNSVEVVANDGKVIFNAVVNKIEDVHECVRKYMRPLRFT